MHMIYNEPAVGDFSCPGMLCACCRYAPAWSKCRRLVPGGRSDGAAASSLCILLASLASTSDGEMFEGPARCLGDVPTRAL
jgi:hypothetical protein